MIRAAEVAAFIHEREKVRRAKMLDKPKPWTNDVILQNYRFCNINREHDKVTRWINDNWRKPYADHPNLWFAMCLARQINLPETLEEIGFPEVWRPQTIINVMLDRYRRKEKVWTPAYLIRGDVQRGGDKPTYVINNMDKLWRSQDQPTMNDSLESYHSRLVTYPGWGSFLAAQAVADLKYTCWLEHAPDWWTWAAAGPGSMRGLNRYFGYPLKHTFRRDDFLVALRVAWASINPLLEDEVPRLCAQNQQNVFCEWDKYERTRLEEGRPRQRYQGK